MVFFPTNQKLFSFVLVIFTTSFLLLETEFVNSDETVTFNLADYISGENIFTLQGNALIKETHLELTTNEVDPYTLVGRALYPTPIRIWDSATGNVASFVTSFNFWFLEYNSYTPADGLVFFLAPSNSAIPNNATGGQLGVVDGNTAFNRFVGVEFDNYVNGWDPKYPHIGINVNSVISSKTAPWSPAMGILANATIIYDSHSKTFSVALSDFNGQVTTVAQVVDLKDVLPETVNIGLSSSTSFNARQIVFIETWSFTSFLKTTISSSTSKNINNITSL